MEQKKKTTQAVEPAAPAFLCGGCVYAYDCKGGRGRCSRTETEIKLNEPACEHGEKRL